MVTGRLIDSTQKSKPLADGKDGGGGGGGGGGWFAGGGGTGDGRPRDRDTRASGVAGGAGGGGGSSWVDTSRATVRAARRLGGGGWGAAKGYPAQHGRITIAWGPRGQVQGADGEASPGGGRDGVHVLPDPLADTTESLQSGALPIGALPPLPEVKRLHLVSVYDGGDEGLVRLSYGQVEEPFVLALGSFGMTHWDLGHPPPTLRGVLVTGPAWLHHLPKGLPVRRIPGDGYIDSDEICQELTGGAQLCRGRKFSALAGTLRLAGGLAVSSWARHYHREQPITVPGVRIVTEGKGAP